MFLIIYKTYIGPILGHANLVWALYFNKDIDWRECRDVQPNFLAYEEHLRRLNDIRKRGDLIKIFFLGFCRITTQLSWISFRQTENSTWAGIHRTYIRKGAITYVGRTFVPIEWCMSITTSPTRWLWIVSKTN